MRNGVDYIICCTQWILQSSVIYRKAAMFTYVQLVFVENFLLEKMEIFRWQQKKIFELDTLWVTHKCRR